MKNSDFFKIALLIILAGFMYYLVTPKFTFNANGRVRKNLSTGKVEILTPSSWREVPQKQPKPAPVSTSTVPGRTYKLSELQ